MAGGATYNLNQLTSLVRGLTLRQQVTLVVGAALVAATLWGFVQLIGKANYKPLYSGLSPGEAQSIARRLSEKNVPYELSSDGTSLRVPADQLDKVRLDLAAQGLPQSGRLGFELFDKPNWAGSDFAEKVNYQRALEGELERTIQSLAEIEAVRVHLVLARDSIFTERERQAKASVVVKLRGGRLPDEAFEAITHLVASAVDNLPAENVTVVDDRGHLPLLAHHNGPGGKSGRSDSQETALAQKLVVTLTPIVGPERVKANVSVEYELASSENTQETFDTNNAVVLSSQVSEDRLGDKAPGGIPGTASNVPGKQPTPGTTPAMDETVESQTQRTESKTFAVGKTVRHAVIPAGAIKRVTAAVLVDDAVEAKEENGQKSETRRKRTPEEMKQIQDLAQAAIGIDSARGDRLAVENLSFLPLPVEEISAPTAIDRLAPQIEKWLWLVRYLALAALFGLIYALVLRPVRKQVVDIVRQLPGRLAPESKSLPGLQPAAGREIRLPGELALDVETILPQDLAEASSEVKQAVILKRHLVDKVRKEPEGAGRLIQNWIREGEAGK